MLIFLSWILSLLPFFIQYFLISAFGFFYGFSSKSTKAIIQLLQPPVLRKVFSLAKQEMVVVNELDEDLVSLHKKKLWFYYGSKDGWVPVSYYQNMRVKFPYVEMQLCKRGFYHSFVLQNSHDMGQLLGNLISENIS